MSWCRRESQTAPVWLGWVRKPKGLETRPDSDAGALSSVQADKTPLLPFQ